MMAEHETHARTQTLSEQAAPFPTNPPQTEEFTISPNIIPSVNKASEKTPVDPIADEMSKLLPKLGSEVAFANMLVDDPAKQEMLADTYATTVETMAGELSDNSKSELAINALAALRRMPRRFINKRLVKDLETANQIAIQRSQELQESRDDITSIEDTLKARKARLEKLLMGKNSLSDSNRHIQNELYFINGILERHEDQGLRYSFDAVETPSADELNERLRNLTPDSYSPARGIKIGQAVAGMFNRIKDVVLLDEELLDDKKTALR